MQKSNSNKRKKSPGKKVAAFRRDGVSKKKSFKGNAKGNEGVNKDLIRLNKYVANSGVCSRRDADIYIASGNVTVNGKTITEMGYKVKLTDEVKFDGRLLNPIKKEYVLLNKPKDFSTMVRDEKGKRNVSGLISNASKSPLLPVDKMDKSATGLLLFTNDGDLTKRLKKSKKRTSKNIPCRIEQNFEKYGFKENSRGNHFG